MTEVRTTVPVRSNCSYSEGIPRAFSVWEALTEVKNWQPGATIWFYSLGTVLLNIGIWVPFDTAYIPLLFGGPPPPPFAGWAQSLEDWLFQGGKGGYERPSPGREKLTVFLVPALPHGDRSQGSQVKSPLPPGACNLGLKTGSEVWSLPQCQH